MADTVIKLTPAKRERNRRTASLGQPAEVYIFPHVRRGTNIAPRSPNATSLTVGAPSHVDYGSETYEPRPYAVLRIREFADFFVLFIDRPHANDWGEEIDIKIPESVGVAFRRIKKEANGRWVEVINHSGKSNAFFGLSEGV